MSAVLIGPRRPRTVVGRQSVIRRGRVTWWFRTGAPWCEMPGSAVLFGRCVRVLATMLIVWLTSWPRHDPPHVRRVASPRPALCCDQVRSTFSRPGT